MATPEAKHRLTTIRCRLLPFVAVGAILTLISPACASQPTTLATPGRKSAISTPTIPTVKPTTTPSVEPTQEPEITSYYPELRDYPILSKGEFATDRTHTKWLNLSKMGFNPNIALITFRYFEELGKSQKIISYLNGNQSIPFGLNQRLRTERVLFFIPQDAPSPNWPNISFTASTTGRFTGGPYVTFVRIPNSGRDIAPSLVFTTTEAAANKAFSVEACQSSIQISSLTPEVANLGQELVCNSYGVAFASKQTGLAFDKYQSWAKDVLIRQDPKSPSYPLYVLPEQEYNLIPQVGQSVLGQ